MTSPSSSCPLLISPPPYLLFSFVSPPLSPAFFEVGGYSELVERYHVALPSATQSLDPQRYNISPECYTPRADAFSLLRDPSSGDLPWPGVLFGIAIVGGWYWCTDQVQSQSYTDRKSVV